MYLDLRIVIKSHSTRSSLRGERTLEIFEHEEEESSQPKPEVSAVERLPDSKFGGCDLLLCIYPRSPGNPGIDEPSGWGPAEQEVQPRDLKGRMSKDFSFIHSKRAGERSTDR